MDPLREIREALNFYARVSFDPIIRKLWEVVKVVQPDPSEDVTPQQCIRALGELENACKEVAKKGHQYVDDLEREGYDDDMFELLEMLDFDVYVPLEEYTDPDRGLMYSLQERFRAEFSEENGRQYERIERALRELEENSA